MRIKASAILYAAFVLMVAPATAWAFGAGAGCADLPEYDRAVGALEGMPGACDMSVEEARRIVAAQQGGAAAVQPPAYLPPRVRHYRHRRHRLHPLRD